MNWTQPVCPSCFSSLMGPTRDPVTLKDAELENCCTCGQPTRAGIYIRIDPRSVKFPRE